MDERLIETKILLLIILPINHFSFWLITNKVCHENDNITNISA